LQVARWPTALPATASVTGMLRERGPRGIRIMSRVPQRQTPSPHTFSAAVRRQAVLNSALCALAVIVLLGVLRVASRAGLLLSVLLGYLAVLRASLPFRAVGALAVLSRGLDVTVLVVLAISLGVLSASPNLCALARSRRACREL